MNSNEREVGTTNTYEQRKRKDASSPRAEVEASSEHVRRRARQKRTITTLGKCETGWDYSFD